MAKLTLTDLSNITGAESTAISTINSNSAAIEAALENTLSRDGTTPNTMSADLDMNSNDILNVGNISVDDLTVDGVSIDTQVASAASSASAAASSASSSASSAASAQGYSEAAESSALVAAQYDGPVVDTFAELSSLTYSELTVGDYVRVLDNGYNYKVLSSGASGADLDYTGSSGCKFDVQLKSPTDVSAFGTDGAAVNKALSVVSAAGGGEVHLSSDLSTSETILLQDDTSLVINGGVTLTLTAVQGSFIDWNNANNAGVLGTGTLAVGGYATYALFAEGVSKPRLGPITVTGWKYGVFWCSTASTAITDVLVEDGFTLGTPHTSDVVSPFVLTSRPSVNGLFGKRGRIGLINIKDTTAGSYTSNNEHTADQVQIQGFHDLKAGPVVSENGGENGVTISWGSSNVSLTAYVNNSDAHGVNIGGGSVPVDISSITGTFQEGESFTTAAGYDGVVGHEFQSSGRLYLQSVGNGKAEPTTITGTTSGATATIDTVYLTSNITLTDESCVMNSGLDEASSGSNYAGVYLQQAEKVRIGGHIENNPYGLYVTQSSYLTNSNLILNNTTDKLESGDVEYLRGFVDDYHSTSVVSSLDNQGRVIFGPNQLSSPRTVSGNSSSNNGVAVDGSGRLSTVGNATSSYKANRTGTSSTKLGLVVEVYDDGVTTNGGLANGGGKTEFHHTSGVIDTSGTGSPESVVTASVGSTYRQTDGSSGTTLWIKESGISDTGWVSVREFTSANESKLDGIEASADVTDAVNVAAAGALMDSDLLDEDDLSSDSATAPASQQSIKAYVDNQNSTQNLKNLFAIKATDETVTSSTTLQDDDDLSVSLEANTAYSFEMFLDIDTTATADFKFKVVVPSGTNARGVPQTAVNAYSISDLTVDISPNFASTEVRGYTITGSVVTSGTSGTLQLQWAQNTSDATGTTLKEGSWIRLQKA